MTGVTERLERTVPETFLISAMGLDVIGNSRHSDPAEYLSAVAAGGFLGELPPAPLLPARETVERTAHISMM
jgi:hypothetical protein